VAFTAFSALITLAWAAFPLPYWPVWGLRTWFVCYGMILLSVSRFAMRHSIPAPELWLMSFPFLFGFWFRTVCPSNKIASFDQLLWVFDRNYGYPEVPLGKLFAVYPALILGSIIMYLALPTLFVILYLALPEEMRRKYLAAIALTGIIILPLYYLCPGAGPAYVFPGHFPWSLPVALSPHRVFLRGLVDLNTTPSGHAAWAFLLFWFAHKYCTKWVAAIFGSIAAATAIAILGLGEHYLIDIILAVPYTVAIWALVERQWKRAAINMAVLLAWMVALREGWALSLPLGAVWLATGATVSCALKIELRRASALLDVVLPRWELGWGLLRGKAPGVALAQIGNPGGIAEFLGDRRRDRGSEDVRASG